MSSVFLSYARGDDGEPFDPGTSFVARLHRDLTGAGFDVWFDRVSMPSRRLTFHHEIRDAILARDRLVLVVGPRAAGSLYVRQEWQTAYFAADKVVSAVLRAGTWDHVPAELAQVHCEDFRPDPEYAFHLANLVRQLREPVPPLGRTIGVPVLPAAFLSRPAVQVAVRDALRADLDGPVVVLGPAARVGLYGMGGAGTSVAAVAVARDRRVREAFPDGVVWVGLGARPAVAELLRRVHRDLGGDGGFQTEHEGRLQVGARLANKAVLLVLDGAWRREDIDWFDTLGPGCRMLITTRDRGLLDSAGVAAHAVDVLSRPEALDLLAEAAGVEPAGLPAEAGDLIERCGRLPLAIALCGGMLRGNTPAGDLLAALRDHELEFVSDAHSLEPRHVDLWRAMEVSVLLLGDRAGAEPLLRDAAARFAELAVFPPDEPVPEAAAVALWAGTAGLPDRHARKLLALLSQRSLVRLSRPAAGPASVSLHPLLADLAVRLYRREVDPDERTLHARLVGAYAARCPDGWASGPDDGYFFAHLGRHLVAAGRAGELVALAQDLRWLEAKVAAGLTFDLGEDFGRAAAAAPTGDPVRGRLALLAEAVRRDAHFLARHAKEYPQGLFQCLWNRCWWYDAPDAAAHYEEGRAPGATAAAGLHRLVEGWREEREGRAPGFAWVRSRRPPPAHLGTALRAEIRGHQGRVTSACGSPDGRWLASGGDDRTVRVWAAATGAQQHCLKGHTRQVTGVAFAPDSRLLASGSEDGSVRVWDAATGAPQHVLTGHDGRVTGVAFAPDGRTLASGSRDGTVRVWDAATGQFCRRMADPGREVLSVAFSADGRALAGGCGDGTVRVWDAATGAQRHLLGGHDGPVTGVAFAPDGRALASGSRDGTVRVWDAATGAQRHLLGGHDGPVTGVAFAPDGRALAAGGSGGTVRVWDLAPGGRARALQGHDGPVGGLAFTADGRALVTGSGGGTLHVWDTTVDAPQLRLRGHDDRVTGVAFAPDGRTLASGSWDGTVRVWDAATGRPVRTLSGHAGAVWCLAYGADGRALASGDGAGVVRVWDPADGAERLCLPGGTGRVGSVALSADGRALAGGHEDGTVRVWDLAAPAEPRRLPGHRGLVGSVAFAADGRALASGDGDGVVRVWDLATAADPVCLTGHDSWVDGLAFAADGRTLVSGGNDGTVRVWDVATGACLRVVPRRVEVRVLAGGGPFAWRADAEGPETVIASAADGRPVGWLAGALRDFAGDPSGRTRAGSDGRHIVGLFTLEGQPRG